MTTALQHIENGEWVPDISFGDRLRIIRRKRHRTQDEMAALLDVKKVTYGSWEVSASTPPHDEIIKLARKLYMLDRVPQWWTLGAPEPADSLRASARSSTDRASDYGSEELPRAPFQLPSRKRERRRHMGVVPLRLIAADEAASA